MRVARRLTDEEREQLAVHFPERGPCAFCGHPDARHRVWDMLLDSPDDDETTAWWYDVPVNGVRIVRAIRPYRRRRKEVAA